MFRKSMFLVIIRNNTILIVNIYKRKIRFFIYNLKNLLKIYMVFNI